MARLRLKNLGIIDPAEIQAPSEKWRESKSVKDLGALAHFMSITG